MLSYFRCESDLSRQDLSSLILSKFFNQPVDWDANNSGQVAPSFDTGASAKNRAQIAPSHCDASTGDQGDSGSLSTTPVVMALVHEEEASRVPSPSDIGPSNENQDQIVPSHCDTSTGDRDASESLPATPVVAALVHEEEAFHVQSPFDTGPSYESQDQIIRSDSDASGGDQADSESLSTTPVIAQLPDKQDSSPNVSFSSEAEIRHAHFGGGTAPAISAPVVQVGHAASNTKTVPHVSALPPLNQYERTIISDEYSVLDDPLLRCTPYIVNIRYMVLICIACRHCVNPACASEHLRKHHAQCKVGPDFEAQLHTKYPTLVAEMIHPPDVIEPVFGLAIPVEEYTVCARCRRGYINSASWRSHACVQADAKLEGIAHFPSLVQTFFRGPKVCYFPVKLPVSMKDEVVSDDFDLFKSASHNITISDDEAEPGDYRELNQFLLKEGWIKHVSGFHLSDLSLLAGPPTVGETLQNIVLEVIGLMTNIQNAIGMAGYHVRRLLGRRPA
jgi:hypothetical protein